MPIRHIATYKWVETEEGILLNRRYILGGSSVIGFIGLSQIFLPSSAISQVNIPGYLIKKLIVPAAINFGSAIVSRCLVKNTGDDAAKKKLNGQLRGQDGSLEDEDSANIEVDPGEVAEYELEFEPDDPGTKKVVCSTSYDSKYRIVRVN